MTIPTLPGITPKTITTERIATRVLFSGSDDGVPVLFLHGNASSATWWEETMIALPAGYRGIAPDQRGFGEADVEKKVDATRGAGDWADDAAALLDALGIGKAHVVGNSLGGMVVWRLLADHPQRLLSATVVDTGSPYGFGGTKDVDGTPCWPDFAGSGGGLSNPELIKRLAEQDRGMDSRFSPRLAIRTLLVKPPFIPAREEELLSSMFTTHLGPQDNPGDFVPSPNWPFVVLWVRGSHDLAVGDASLSCPGTLGSMGAIPGWPGMAVYPPQPMLGQTRAVLERYAAAGGSYREVVIHDAGHVPFIEKPDEFNAVFHAHLAVM